MDVKEHLKRRREASIDLNLTQGAKTADTDDLSIQTVEDGAIAFRLTLISKKDEMWSYPYATMGLVQMKSPDSLVIFGGCGRVESITIQGRGLHDVIRLISQQRLLSIREADHAAFSDAGIAVSKIQIRLY